MIRVADVCLYGQNQDSRNLNEFAGVKFHQHNLPVVSQQYLTLLSACVHCQMAQFQLNFNKGNTKADIRSEEEQANVQMWIKVKQHISSLSSFKVIY